MQLGPLQNRKFKSHASEKLIEKHPKYHTKDIMIAQVLLLNNPASQWLKDMHDKNCAQLPPSCFYPALLSHSPDKPHLNTTVYNYSTHCRGQTDRPTRPDAILNFQIRLAEARQVLNCGCVPFSTSTVSQLKNSVCSQVVLQKHI